MSRKPSFAPPQGQPPTIEWCGVDQLQVDPGYQRDATAPDSLAMIKRIAGQWDWRLCAPLTVSRRIGAGLYVIDGQHRLEAARLRGDIPHLPCITSTFENPEDEARCFVQVNTARRKVTAIDTFRAQLAAGDERALEMHRIITDAGLTLAPHTCTNSWKPLQFGALGGLGSAIAQHGSLAAERALGDIAAAFAREPLRSAGTILRGLYAVHGRKLAEPGVVRRTLAMRTQAQWLALMIQRQVRHGEMADSAMTHAIADACKTQGATA